MNKPNIIRVWEILSGRLKNERLRGNVLQALPFWVASLITGLIAVFYARLFAYAEQTCFSIFHKNPLYIFLLVPACFVTAWLMVRLFARNAGGSGIPQVMASIELATPKHHQYVDKLLGVKTVIVKICSSLVMVLGGGAIGREGPTIQIAGGVFRKINQLTPKTWPRVSKKNMILTGAAAGLAAAFNTPLGGIVFAVEELAKTHINYFKTAIFTAVIIAGLTAQGILGPYLYLGYPRVNDLSGYIYLYIIIVACMAGLLGSFMSKGILKLLSIKKGLTGKWDEFFYVMCCAAVVALTAYFFSGAVLGSGKEQMSQILFSDNKYGGWETALVRTIGPVLSFTTGAAGGIFAPSLAAGATIGSWISQLLTLAPSDTNLVVLAGMVAFLTGVTKSPFTSAILVLEMTDRHSVIFHLMLAAMLANLISDLVMRHSLYEHLTKRYMEGIETEDEEHTAETEAPAAVRSEE